METITQKLSRTTDKMVTGGEESVGYSLAKVETLTLEKTTDRSPWYISIVVCQDKIVVLDKYECKVQLFRLYDGQFLATTVRLESLPRDLYLMDAMTICVLHGDGPIKMMSIDCTDMSRGLETTRTLCLQGEMDEYYSVVRFKDNLVVIGKKQNTLYWCVVSLHDGHVDAIHQIFKGSGWHSCSVTTKDNMVYFACVEVFNYYDNTGVFGFDILNLRQCKYTYKHRRLQKPTSIVINEDGNIFVCNCEYDDSCIHQLTALCQPVAIFTQGIPWFPQAMFWDNGRLYVICLGSRDINLFTHVYQGSHKASEAIVSDERKQHVSKETAIQIGQENVDKELSVKEMEMALSGKVPDDSKDDNQEDQKSSGVVISKESKGPVIQETSPLVEQEIVDKGQSIVGTEMPLSGQSPDVDKEEKQDIHDMDQRKEETVQHLFQNFNRHTFEGFLSENKCDQILQYVFNYILKTKHREALCMILDKIQVDWRKQFRDSNLVLWVGSNYGMNREGELTLVCYHMDDILPKVSVSNYLGLPVLYRHFLKIEREPLEIRIHKKYQHMSLSEIDASFIERLIQSYGDELFNNHSNLEAISASSVISSKTRGCVEETSLVLYCRLKGVVPFEESFFPRELNIEDRVILTDVREGFFTFGMPAQQENVVRSNPRNWNNPLKIGCSIGSSSSNSAGTLGPFVRLVGEGKGFLTCAHVFGVSCLPRNTQIVAVQPANGEADNQVAMDRRCGVLQDVMFDTNRATSIDAALVEIENRGIDPTGFTWDHSSELEQTGFSEAHPPSFQNGKVIEELDFKTAVQSRVIKCGRSTGLTRGSFALRGPAIRIHDASLNLPNGIAMNNQTTHIMKGQYLVEGIGNEPFFKGGDSGSGVYLVNGENKLALVGLAIGSLTPVDCVVTPIGPVLNALGLNKDSVMTEDDMDI